MPGPIDSSGEIETMVQTDAAPGSRRTITFEAIVVGDRVGLVFSPRDEPTPPYALTIRAPSGKLIVDRVIRELPTGEPQSGPPVEFVASTRGEYQLNIRELRGAQKGEARIVVD